MKETIVQVYNILSEITTKGEDTMRMAACLDGLRNVYQALELEESSPVEESEEE